MRSMNCFGFECPEPPNPDTALDAHRSAAAERLDGLGIVKFFDGDNEAAARRRLDRACVGDGVGGIEDHALRSRTF